MYFWMSMCLWTWTWSRSLLVHMTHEQQVSAVRMQTTADLVAEIVSEQLCWTNLPLKTASESKCVQACACARPHIRQACIGSNHNNTGVGSFLFFFFAYLCAHVAPETLVQVSSFRSVERKSWKRIWRHAHSVQYMMVMWWPSISNILRTQGYWLVMNLNK